MNERNGQRHPAGKNCGAHRISGGAGGAACRYRFTQTRTLGGTHTLGVVDVKHVRAALLVVN